MPRVSPDEFNLVSRGSFHRLGSRFGLARATLQARLLKIVLLILVTWVPMFVLSLAEGHASGTRVAVPLLSDPAIYSRLLFVVPLLVIAEVLVGTGLFVQVRHFLISGIVAPSALEDFESARARVMRGAIPWSRKR